MAHPDPTAAGGAHLARQRGFPAYQVFDANGQFLRRVEWAPRLVWAVSTGLMPDLRGGAVFVAVAGVLPDGSVAFSDSLAYAIKIARTGTGVWRILKRPLEPIPVTRRVRAAERERRFIERNELDVQTVVVRKLAGS